MTAYLNKLIAIILSGIQRTAFLWTVVGITTTFVVISELRQGLTDYLEVYKKTIVNLEEFKDYYAFNPRTSDEKKYGLISSSFFIQNGIMNEADGSLRRHGIGYFGQVLNHILKTEYTTDVRFYDTGRSGTSSWDHLWFLYHFKDAPGAAGIIYSNGYTAISGLYKEELLSRNLVTMYVLERLLEEYPQLNPQIDTLIQYFERRKPFKAAVELYGEDWRDLIDPVTLLFYYPDAKRNVVFTFKEWPQPVRDIFLFVPYVRDLVIRLFMDFSLERDAEWEQETRQQFTDALSEYGKKIHDYPNIISLSSAPKKNRKVIAAFYELLAGITKKEELDLIFYDPPSYEISPYQYWSVLKPNFLDIRKKQFSSEDYDHVKFIDHIFLDNMNQYDPYYRARSACEGDCKKGHNVGLIGNVKRSRALLNSFTELDLLEKPVHKIGEAFIDESKIPDIEMCFNIAGLDIDSCHFIASDYLNGSVASKSTFEEYFDMDKTNNAYLKRIIKKETVAAAKK